MYQYRLPEQDNSNDAILAALMCHEEDNSESIMMQIVNDARIAQKLNCMQYIDCKQENENQDAHQMKLSTSGAAILLVNRFLEQIQEVLLCYPEFVGRIAPVSIDDMIPIVERLKDTKNQMKDCYGDLLNDETMIDFTVDIGYHYTDARHIDQISIDGLLTRTEQQVMNDIQPTFRKDTLAFGDGIYTGNNPFAFTKYGEIGLIVARLKGRIVKRVRNEHSFEHTQPVEEDSYDTIYANAYRPTKKSHYWDQQVLSHSSQCIPIVQYDSFMIQRKFHTDNIISSSTDDNCNRGNCCIVDLHERLQNVIDEILNDGIPTRINIPLNVVSAITFESKSKSEYAVFRIDSILNESMELSATEFHIHSIRNNEESMGELSSTEFGTSDIDN